MGIDKKKLDSKVASIIGEMRGIRSLADDSYDSVLDKTLEDVQNHEFRVTVVGEFSSGKSTFLSAIIGKDVLPHAVSETTATITYIHNVPLTDKRLNKAFIHFYEKDDAVFDIIKEKEQFQNHLSAVENKEVNVIKEVKSVDVYVNFAGIDESIVLIDTPGMNGMADGHRDITMQEICRSHASICLFHLKGVGKTDCEFVKELMKYQDTFFFVINQIDEIKEQEESVENRIEKFRNEIFQNIYEGKEQPKNVFGISALCALTSRDESLKSLYKEDEGKELTKEDREKLWKKSRMELLEKSLFEYLSGSEKEFQFYETILHRLLGLLDRQSEALQSRVDLYSKKLEDLPEKKQLEELLSIVEKNYEKTKTALKNELGSAIDDLEKKKNEALKMACYRQFDELKRELSAINTIEELERKQDSFGNKVSNFYASQSTNLASYLRDECNKIYENLLNIVNKSIPAFEKKQVQVGSSVNIQYKETGGSIYDSTEEAKKQREISELEKQRQQLQGNLSVSEQEMRLETARRKQQALQNEQASERQGLGSRPQAKVSYDTIRVIDHYETHERNRRFLWFDLPDICGKKTETVPVYTTITNRHTDDSAGQAWDRRKSAIDEKYNAKLRESRSELEMYEGLLETARENEQLRMQVENRLARKRAELENLRKEAEFAKQNARTTYLKSVKQQIERELNDWLSDGGTVYVNLKSCFLENVRNCQRVMNQSINAEYEKKVKEWKENVRIVLQREMQKGETKENQDKVNAYKIDLKKIEEVKREIESEVKSL